MEKEPLRLWIDTDPSGLVWTGLDCDDDLALLAALALEQGSPNFHLEGLSICGGNAPLSHTCKDVELLLNHAGVYNITPVCGAGWQAMQVGWKSLRFFSWLTPDMDDLEDAVKALLSAAQDAPSKSLTVLTLGPPTNLARALQQAPWLQHKLKHVFMMGGELTQSRLDLNFISDRAAARIVVQADVPTTLIPIQTCAQVVFTQENLDGFEEKCCARAAACALLPKMKHQVQLMPWLVNRHVQPKMISPQHVPSPHLMEGFIPWDLVALMAVAYPELFDEWQHHAVDFPECNVEPCDGNMIVSSLISTSTITNHSGIVRIPHALRNETEFMEITLDLLCQIEAHGPPPHLLWGFLNQVAGLLFAIVILTRIILRYI